MLAAVCVALAALAIALAVALALRAFALREARLAAEDQGRLAAVEARRRAELMERCGAAILYLTPDGRIVQSNALARETLGVAVPAAPGTSLIEAALSEEMVRLLREAVADRQPHAAEVRLGAGGRRLLEVSVTQASVPSGAVELYLLTAIDITELRRLETVRRDFVANVSHEMRTPLASIRAMAETLQSGAMEDREVAGRFLQTVIDEANRLTRITDDLLVLSDAESQPPQRTQFALRDLVEDVVGRSRPPADNAGVSLTFDVPAEIEMDASYDQIEQVVVNLVDNGIKYTHAGGSVHVSAAIEGERVVVHVRDTGIGIMQDHLPRIFERFYRVDKARSRKSGGTGLGLSIVKRIVEAHGGEVTVSSEYNHGSTFTFWVPAPPSPR